MKCSDDMLKLLFAIPSFFLGSSLGFGLMTFTGHHFSKDILIASIFGSAGITLFLSVMAMSIKDAVKENGG